MKEWSSVDEILDFAISGELEAAQFYTDLATGMGRPWMRRVFEDFAREEMGHKVKLEAVKRGQSPVILGGRVTDLKIGDYLVDVEPSPDMEYQDALVVAMKKEKAAFKLYIDLAEATDDAEVKALFLALAQEEAKHKLRFEIEYDDMVLTEN